MCRRAQVELKWERVKAPATRYGASKAPPTHAAARADAVFRAHTVANATAAAAAASAAAAAASHDDAKHSCDASAAATTAHAAHDAAAAYAAVAAAAAAAAETPHDPRPAPPELPARHSDHAPVPIAEFPSREDWAGAYTCPLFSST